MRVGGATALALALVVAFLLGIAVGAAIFPRIFPRAETVTRILAETSTAYATTTLTETVTHTETVKAVETITHTAGAATLITTKTITLSQVQGVCFSATEDCVSMLIGLIRGAKRSVHVMVYSLTLDGLSEALIEAKNRGVDVKVVIEADNALSKGSEYQRLLEAGVEVRLDGNPYLMHHKAMIVDGEIVVTGSYNWSWSAENRNDENLVIIKDAEIASLYEAEFQRVWSRAT